MSREEISKEPFERPVAVISVRNPGGPWPDIPQTPHVRAVLRLEFEDVDDPELGLAMSAAQAAEVLDFARRHLEAGAEIVCQCEAGISRSAGMAAALSRIHFGHDGGFHRTHRPNAWVRRCLLNAAHGADPAVDAPDGAMISGVRLLPTALPNAVLVRDGTTWEWKPRTEHTYPPGTLGGTERTLAAHAFVPLQGRGGKYWNARAIGTWVRRELRERDELRYAMVITRAGAWKERLAGGAHGRSEPAVEIYLQTTVRITRDAWTKALRGLSDDLGKQFHQERFDVVLAEDGLMYKRAVWQPSRSEEDL
jgi:hypothetical protein